MAEQDWTWDSTLYAGSAPFYSVGRVAYPPELADHLAEVLELDGSGRLLDIGCGPGSLTLLLAPYFAEAIGLDADPDMLAEARRLAAEAGCNNLMWRHLRAEQLPAGIARPDVITFAQSFHWMDRPHVAATVRDMLSTRERGAVVHVGATTHEGISTDLVLPHPTPPREALHALIRSYLGEARRAGQSTLPTATPPNDEDAILRTAGFRGPRRVELPERTVERSATEVRASIYSLSSAAPHLFGHQLNAFDADLSQLLTQTSPDGRFSERLRGITLSIWR